MDSLPPNDPNNNNNNNSPRGKPDPNGSDDDGEMDIVGNLQEQPAVVMMFLMGVASWLLRERCTC
eukprot:CAMPEP_0178912456 /NCGR_PEP_ID=MMETSP0786-20121207/10275_1 /TAXON_ID=186022 /ORGANISM="Thalassionema frauenfeldii, Strain CCMP 1798" /LENGTH=64 /DNA_ID=CAMNT_0020585045 /DNA_START=64 /DNA_END=258 /DNA_ORIENTATION=-